MVASPYKETHYYVMYVPLLAGSMRHAQCYLIAHLEYE